MRVVAAGEGILVEIVPGDATVDEKLRDDALPDLSRVQEHAVHVEDHRLHLIHRSQFRPRLPRAKGHGARTARTARRTLDDVQSFFIWEYYRRTCVKSRADKGGEQRESYDGAEHDQRLRWGVHGPHALSHLRAAGRQGRLPERRQALPGHRRRRVHPRGRSLQGTPASGRWPGGRQHGCLRAW